MSFVGFMAHYVHRIDPLRRLVPAGDQQQQQQQQHPVFLMAGYSYGAMITAQLPPLDEVLALFASPDSGSHAAQIRLRAESWAERLNRALQQQQQDGRAAATKQGPAAAPTRAHRTTSSSSVSSEKSPSPGAPANGKLSPAEGFVAPQPAYLLVSPLQGLVTHLATMSLVPSVFGRRKSPQDEAEAEAKLVRNPTLAVFGDGDVFVPVGKLRAWVARLGSQPASRFRGHEIASAGHFWAEEGVLHSMLDLVCEFAGRLYDGN